MAKRKKRKTKPKPRRPAAGVTSDPEVILQRAEAQLAEGNPKRAREGFRMLFKTDPERYRDRYIEVTRMVIELRLAEGKTTEAGQLLGHLREIGANAAELGALQIRVATALGESTVAVAAAAEFLDSENAAERIEAADALVLARAEQAAAVCAGIAHLCRGEGEKMKEVLKAIGHGSPFAHWRLFLRGCAAHYGGDPEEAERCFKRLPEGSVPARKSKAFEILRGNWQGAQEQTIIDACLLSGERELARCLPAAEKKWLAGRLIEAYRALKRPGVSFPTLEVTPWGQLNRFFQSAHTHMAGPQGGAWLESLLRLLPSGGRAQPNGESYLVSNVILRCSAGPEHQCEIQDVLWPLFMESRKRLLGSSARFVAMCHLMRSHHEEPDDATPWFLSGRQHRDYGPMIKTLRMAIAADASFQDPPLQLLKIYRHLGRHADANRLLDEMTKRFPESQEVLLAAGTGCLDRKAYAKGLEYLERARAVNPVDPGIQAQIRRGLREKAAEHFRKGGEAQLAKGRETFERLLASVPPRPDPGESRGFLLIQWSVLEEMASGPDAPHAREKLAEAAQEVAPDVAEFYRAIQAQILGASRRAGRRKSRGLFLPAPSQKNAELKQAVQIFELLTKFEESDSTAPSLSARDWSAKYAEAATRKLRREDRELVLQLVTTLARGDSARRKLGAEIVTRQLRTDQHDPHLLCLAWKTQDLRPAPAVLQKAREEAIKRRDRGALEAIKSFEEMQAKKVERLKGESFANVFFDDYEEEDEEEDGFVDPSSADLDELPDELLERLVNLPVAERIRELEMQGLDRVQAEVVSQMVDVFAGMRQSVSGEPSPRKRSSPKNKPRSDGQQIELPF